MSELGPVSVPLLAAFDVRWWLHQIVPGPTSATLAAAAVMVCLICRTAFSRSPGLGFLGALALGYTIFAVGAQFAGIGHWAIQAGLVFLLLHSLRWNDHAHRYANRLRVSLTLLWLAQSFLWVDSEYGLFWMPLISGALVLAVCMASKIYAMEWKKFIVPAAAMAMMLAAPGYAFIQSVALNPVGPWFLFSSFSLLMFGAIAAFVGFYRHIYEQHSSVNSVRDLDRHG
jgi:hypothetical protein